MYIVDNEGKFPIPFDPGEPDKRLMFVLSYMSKGLAGQWADNWTDQYCKPDAEGGGYTQLWENLDTAFLDSQEAKEAQRKLDTLKQGSLSAEEFFQQFENLRLRAGYEGKQHDSYLVNLLEKNFNRDTARTITVQPSPPETYEAWKKVAIRVDNLQKQYDHINPKRFQFQNRYPAASGSTRQSTGASSSSNTPAKAVTFGGQGQPMDIDRTKGKTGCYRCGNPGHFIGNCPVSKDGLKCFKCGRFGHMAKACRSGGQQARIQEVKEESPKEKLRACWGDMSDEVRTDWLREMLVQSGPNTDNESTVDRDLKGSC
jgi:hypothetical protein